MDKTTKIAYVSPTWAKWQHRLLAGVFNYVEKHQRMIVRIFAPITDMTAAAPEVEAWGADGILCDLNDDDQTAFLAGLSRHIPLVNNAIAKAHPDIVTVVLPFQAFMETSITHFRHLGIRSFAQLVLEDNPTVREHLGKAFLKFTNPPAPERAVLFCHVEQQATESPHADVHPIPAKLSKWLHDLPKPTGVTCPEYGVGNYLIRCCNALGLRVPEDIAVIGAAEMDVSLASDPTLTSVMADLEAFGVESIRILTDMIAGKRPADPIIRVGYFSLQVRESTGLRKPEICDIAGALHCIRENACQGLTVERVIKQTQSVSKATFHRRFREVVGKSPAEAIRDRKLDEVRRLLSTTSLPMEMVADLSGFSSAMVLARIFRADEGVSMRDFRKKTRSVPTQLDGGKPV